MNKPVKFTTAKLLKEKEFDKPTYSFYVIDESEYGEIGEFITNPNDNYPDLDDNDMFDTLASAPTISEVVMWLYEKYGIWIRLTPIPYSDNLTHWRWEHMSTNYSTRSLKWKKEQDYMSPTEAYEAAIDYCLTKLI